MENLKNKKGFTLIELLAVIVVLAIVMVLATRAILPGIGNVSKDAIATEANMFVDAASDAISLISIGSITSSNLGANGTDYSKVEDSANDTTTYCFTLKKLVDLGLVKKDLEDYAGSVVVKRTGTKYVYTIAMHNKDLEVPANSGSVSTADVDDYVAPASGSTHEHAAHWTCTSTSR